jgi:AraC-like DNA-binding protein
MVASAGFAPLRFSTREIPERDRVATLREEFGRRLLRIEIEPLSDAPFHAEATLRALPGLRMIACRCAAVSLQRTRANLADGDDSVGIIVSGNCTVSQRGQDLLLGAGDAVAVLHQEPAAVIRAAGFQIGVSVPRAALARLVKGLDDATMRLIPRDREALQLLVSYLRYVGSEPALCAPKLRKLVVGHVHNLIALALSPGKPVNEDGLTAVAAAHLNAALGHIAARFRDPALSLAHVARRQGISPRYLQRLLETSGTSFTARVNELRLAEAFSRLRESHEGEGRISDIALEAGFSDISHFNRLFRSRFGDTPSGIRAGGRGGEATTHS